MHITLHQLETFLESTAGQFLEKSKVEPNRWKKSKSEIKFAKYAGLKPTAEGGVVINFKVASSGYFKTGVMYTSSVYIPNIYEVFKTTPTYSAFTSAIKNADVKVKCNCDDFKFRYEYWLNKDDSLFRVGDPNEDISTSQAPVVTNPNNNIGPFCKHMIKVSQVFLFNMSDYMRDIKLSIKNKTAPIDYAPKQVTLQKNQFMDLVKENNPDVGVSLSKDRGLTESDRQEITTSLDKENVAEVNTQEVELNKDNSEKELEISLEKDHIDSEDTQVELDKEDETSEVQIELEKESSDENINRQV